MATAFRADVIRVLLIEDLPAVATELTTTMTELGVEVDVAVNAADALTYVDEHQHDLVICDLRIPPSPEGVEALNEHGIRVLDHLADIAPGLPVVVFSGWWDDMRDLGDRLAAAVPHDLYGTGAESVLISRDKDDLSALLDVVRGHRDSLGALESSVEISGPEARAVLSDLDERLLSIYTRQRGGCAILVTLLRQGLSGAVAVRVAIEREDGVPTGRAFVKLGDVQEILDEEERYDEFAPLLESSTYASRLQVLRAGARGRGGLFYALAESFRDSLFDVLRNDGPDHAVTLSETLRAHLAPWHNSRITVVKELGGLRRLFVPDARLDESRCTVDWIDPELELTSVRIRESVVHGDLHGDNVLVSGDKPLLIDFGKVGRAPSSLDPVFLELSVVLHPEARLSLDGWPTPNQARHWRGLDDYVEGSPIAGFIRFCRGWARDLGAGDRELDTVVYGAALRQLRFPDVPHELAVAYSAGAASRLQSGSG
jgi:CheY-like chemotaxis protein